MTDKIFFLRKIVIKLIYRLYQMTIFTHYLFGSKIKRFDLFNIHIEMCIKNKCQNKCTYHCDIIIPS